MARSKSSAAERTVDMFAAPRPAQELVPEYIAPEPKEGERVPLEADADRLRDNAFKGQEWTDKYFKDPSVAECNTYRLSLKDGYYYLERLSKNRNGGGIYAYTGVILPADDLFGVTNLLVLAARAKKEKESGKP